MLPATPAQTAALDAAVAALYVRKPDVILIAGLAPRKPS
jgi:hypothetical protein